MCGGGLLTRNLTCYDVARGRPAHPNLCFELGDRRTEINLVKRFVSLPLEFSINSVINLL